MNKIDLQEKRKMFEMAKCDSKGITYCADYFDGICKKHTCSLAVQSDTKIMWEKYELGEFRK